MFSAKVRDYWLMIMAYCELLHQNTLGLFEIMEWLIVVTLANVYLLTNFSLK